MKKKLMYLLVAILGLVSCGGEDSVKAEITVQAESSWMSHYEKAAEKIMKENPGSKITIVESGSFDMIGKITQTDAQNPDVTDVFAYPLDQFTNLNDAVALAAFDAKSLAAKIGGFGDYDKGLGKELKSGKDYLGIPMNIETLVVFANKKNAEAKGIDLSKPIELVQEDVRTVMLPIINTWFAVGATNAAKLEMLGKNEKGFYSDFTKEFSELNAEQKNVIEQLFKYWQKATESKTSLFDGSAVWGYMDANFKDDQAGVLRIEGPWSTGNLSGLTKNLEVLPLSNITIAGQGLNHWKGGWALGINARLEEKGSEAKLKLAEKMIAEILNPENAEEFFKATGKIMPNVTREAYENSKLDEINKKVVLAVIDSYNTAVARPLFKEWNGVWDTWTNAVSSWNTAKPKTTEEAYKQIKASFDAMMQNIKDTNK